MSPEAPVQTAFACSQCGRPFAESDLVQISGNWVCADCKPAFLSLLMARGASPVARHYGGFWIRFGARFIDGLIVGIAQACIAWAFLGTFGAEFLPRVMRSEPVASRMGFQFLAYALAIVYEAAFLHYQGATPGKMALGLKVIRSNGDPLGWGVSFGRYFMHLVSGIILLIGYIMVAFDDEKRALHDRVCDTRVIYK